MPFTDETTIRTHTGWENTDLVPSALIVQRLDDAHEAFLADLDPAHTSSSDPLLKLAETELATAYLLRSLATESGFEDRDIRTANLTLRAGGRSQTLADLAKGEEERAWSHARSFLLTGTTPHPTETGLLGVLTMARIGTFQFPDDTTVIDLSRRFIRGRDRKISNLTSILNRFSSQADLKQAVRDLRREVERFDQGETDLSVHDGRFLMGRRSRSDIEEHEDRGLAVIRLEVFSDDRYERSETEFQATFNLTTSPQVLNFSPGGNWNTPPTLVLTATATISNPSLTDGERTLTYSGDLLLGELIELDGEKRTATKNGTENVLNDISGEFVELTPDSAALTYTDSSTPAPNATLLVKWRDRWV